MLPRWLNGKESACRYRSLGFDLWVGKNPWRREWQPTPVFLPGESHGQRSLVGYSPSGHKELDTTERLNNNRNACVLSLFSHVQLFETLWTVVHWAPLFMGFSRQEYWSRLPCPPPGELPDPGIEPASLASAGRFFAGFLETVNSAR